MESKLQNLSLKGTKDPQSLPTGTIKSQTASKPIMDSWEDDSSGSDTDTGYASGPLSNKKSPGTDAPPPTPLSPSFPTSDIFASQSQAPFRADGRAGAAADSSDKRPEKSAATAGRLIAAGLGMRAPKRTEDQRAYEKAARENEVRKRNRQREAREKERAEDEKAKAAMWDS